MENIIGIFLGGGTGAVSRFLICYIIARYSKLNFPFGTLLVNIFGCFIMGFLFFMFIDKPDISRTLKLSLTVGFCGGLSTFSALSLEVLGMLQHQQLVPALTYIFISVLLCMLAVTLGAYCVRFF